MQEFLNDTLISRYIKSILFNTYIPNYKSVSDGDYIIKDIYYVYNKYVIKCTTSGTIGDSAVYSTITPYDIGDKNYKWMSNFVSKNNYYDTDTHKQLGNYLRLIRDVEGINLMPFYNCFCNKFTSSFILSSEGVVSKQLDNLYKIIEIPIKYNTDYTIAIDSPNTSIIAPAIMSHNDLVTVTDTSISEYLWPQNIKTYASLYFDNPIVYRVNNTDAMLERYERNLTMLIQIPFSNDSSVVVLEGDYTGPHNYITSVEYIDNWTQLEQNKLFLSQLSLLKMNDRNSYAFSDRLIEYLFNNVIHEDEQIRNNIYRVQSDLDAFDSYNAIKDVWDIRLRKLIFDTYRNKNSQIYDANGFVDKDVEKLLSSLRGKN